MMKYYVFLFIFLTSCIPASLIELPSVTESPYNIGSNGTRDRSRLRRGLNNQFEPCKDNRSCIRICDDMYLRASELDECYNSNEETVEDVLDVFETLENPKRISNLNDIDLDDLKTYLKIGIQSFIDLIDEVDKDEDGDRINDDWEDTYAYATNNAEVVLEWFCSERDVREALKNYYEDIKNELVKRLDQESCENLEEEFEEDDGIDSDCKSISWTDNTTTADIDESECNL